MLNKTYHIENVQVKDLKAARLDKRIRTLECKTESAIEQMEKAAAESRFILSVLFDGWKKMFPSNMRSRPSFGLDR